ncbi:MAG: helix-turn-helix domain-containing protein [Oscillospiraceae bacterium]
MAGKIIKLRKQNGWSQEELAEKLGVTRQAVSKWEGENAVPDIDKIIKMSEIFEVSTDYLLKDDAGLPMPVISTEPDNIKSAKSVSAEEANEFMTLSRRISKRIAAAVSLCILSPVSLIFLGGLSEKPGSGLTEEMAGGLGIAILLVFAAIGAAVLILNGMKISKFDYLSKESISLQNGVRDLVEEKKAGYEPTFIRGITAGVVLCILGVVPLMLATALEMGDFMYVCCVDILLILVACGVFLFVSTGIVRGSYMKLLQEEDYTEENKAVDKRTAFFPGAYWCAATAVYLAISFYTESWDKTWIVWPVAGVLFAAVYGILRAAVKARR